MGTWGNDLHKSMDMFDEHIIPFLHKLVGKYDEFVRVEGTDEEIAKRLDTQAGIDGLIKKNDMHYGLGSRIQVDSGVWPTFTIRCDRESGHITEFEKLIAAVKNDAVRPHFTMQAYIVNNELQAIAMIRTVDLVDYMKYYQYEIKEKTSYDKNGWARFKVIRWDDLFRHGYRFVVYQMVNGSLVRTYERKKVA